MALSPVSPSTALINAHWISPHGLWLIFLQQIQTAFSFLVPHFAYKLVLLLPYISYFNCLHSHKELTIKTTNIKKRFRFFCFFFFVPYCSNLNLKYFLILTNLPESCYLKHSDTLSLIFLPSFISTSDPSPKRNIGKSRHALLLRSPLVFHFTKNNIQARSLTYKVLREFVTDSCYSFIFFCF